MSFPGLTESAPGACIVNMIRQLLLLLSTLNLLQAGETLRLLSYNLHHGEGTDGKVDLPRIADYIKAQTPDVVFLQEIDRNCTRSGKVEQAAELGRLTGLTPVFAKFMNFQGGEYGQAILTKFPVQHSRTVELPAGSEPRSSAVATVKAPWGPLTVANVHFYETEAQRLSQAQALVAALDHGKTEAILMGDFNSEPGDKVISWLSSLYTFPDKLGELKATWPSDNPKENIDHIFYRLEGGWKIREYRVLEEKIISDHRPLLCVMQKD